MERPSTDSVREFVQGLADPVVVARQALGVEPTQKQAQALRCLAPVRVVIGPRQVGKTVLLGMDLMVWALFGVQRRYPMVQVLAAQNLKNCRKLLDWIFNDLLPASPIGPGIVKDYSRSLPAVMLFEHGGRIESAPTTQEGRQARGDRADRILLDECAFYDTDDVIDEVFYPKLFTSPIGQLTLASTPEKRGSVLHRYWRLGQDSTEPDVQTLILKAEDNPYGNPSFIDRIRRRMSDAGFRREMGGEFVDESQPVFAWEIIEAAATGRERRRQAGHEYRIGYDVAISATGNDSVAVVADITKPPFRIVRVVDDLAQLKQEEQARRVASLALEYHASVTVDGNGVGAGMAPLLRQAVDELCRVRRRGPSPIHIEAFRFDVKSKPQLVMNLITNLESGRLIIPEDQKVIDGFRFFRAEEHAGGYIRYSKPKSGGVGDDRVDAIALSIWDDRCKVVPESFAGMDAMKAGDDLSLWRNDARQNSEPMLQPIHFGYDDTSMIAPPQPTRRRDDLYVKRDYLGRALDEASPWAVRQYGGATDVLGIDGLPDDWRDA